MAAIALVVGIGACGGTSTSSGEENKSADQIFNDAIGGLDGQAVVHITGTAKDSGGTTTVDALYTADAGRVTTNSPTEGTWISILTGGAGYVQPHGSGFLKVPDDQLPGSPLSLFSVHGFVTCGRPHGALTKGSVSTLNGKRVIAIADDGKAPGAAPSTTYVALDGPALPVRIMVTGPKTPGGLSACGATQQEATTTAATGTATFDFDYPSSSVTITPPPDARTAQP